jgi:nucleoredoxin
MWRTLLGSTLLSKAGPKDIDECLADAEYVMVYVSAHWCGPCRAMTPRIASAYERQAGNNVRVVFLSLDHSHAQFDEYFATMPWHAIPYDEDRHETLDRLSDLAQRPIQSIPTLIVLDREGRVVTSDGCSNVEQYLTPAEAG